MKKKGFITLIFSFLITGSIFASSDSTIVKTNTLTLAAIYGNNANYYGQTASERLPYLLSNASLQLKSGFYLSAGAYRLLNSGGSAISELDLSAGFETDLAKDLSGSFGYTRSFFPENSPMIQAANQNTLSASLAYDWFLKSSLSSYYAFGTQQDVFLSFSNSKAMNLGSLFDENDFISLEPGFELVGGTLHYLEEYKVRQESRGLFGNPMFPGNSGQYTTATRNASTFDMLTYNANLLLGYNRGNYLIETGYQLSVLGKNVSEGQQKPHSFFNLSFYYQF